MDGALPDDHVSVKHDGVTGARAISAHTYLAGTPHAAPLARIFVREHLRRELPRPLLETVELLTTELVTNVVLHAKTSIRLGVTCDEHNVVVSVEDNNHIGVSGLTEGTWSEVTLNFTRDAARNDGSAKAFQKGELVFFAIT